ncbi:MAG: hypothetical protein ACYDEJ_17265 [Desulfitobacteriaceae bacterium]
MLLATVSDEKIRNRYDNFSKGYSAEELFRRIYSLLPWIKLITPLGQEQSSSYKISFEHACLNDLLAIFGDYSYVFRERPYRKSRFSNSRNLESVYFHSHEKYGLTVYEGLSIDGKEYHDLCCIETAVLDCALDFEQVDHRKINELETEVIERLKNSIYNYKLSTLMLGYLLKIYCYNNNDIYYRNNSVVENTFGIVDTVRRKCGGEKFYLLPHDKKSITYSLMKIQFGKVPHIFGAYSKAQREEGHWLMCSHDLPFKG